MVPVYLVYPGVQAGVQVLLVSVVLEAVVHVVVVVHVVGAVHLEVVVPVDYGNIPVEAAGSVGIGCVCDDSIGYGSDIVSVCLVIFSSYHHQILLVPFAVLHVQPLSLPAQRLVPPVYLVPLLVV